MSETSTYRGIAKGTAIFGGVQVFQMLINILRGKFIAILLGPAGMGVYSLLLSTINIINQTTSLGLNLGAMRDISMANEEGDTEKLSVVAKIFRRLVFITGCLGAVVSVAGARWWSRLTFGDGEYTWAFVILGLMSFFTAMAAGESTLLQGMRKLRALARTSLIGSATGLVAGVPMFYFWGVWGIAPAMVALALATYLSNRHYTKKIGLVPVVVAGEQTRRYARSMISLGVVLTVGTVLGTLAVYFINWFIRHHGGVADVGFYQAATSITTQYSALIFSAMAVDYLPRLAAVSNDLGAVRKMVNQQGEMVVLIVAPIIVAVLAAAPLIIRILLSAEFMVVVPLVRWMSFALFFKAASYTMGYIAFAKGDKRLFFWLETVWGNLTTIVFSVVGYLLWGIEGLGIAMLVAYLIYFVLLYVIARRRYKFSFEREYVRIFLLLMLLCTAAFGITLLVKDYVWCAVAVGVVLVVTSVFCWKELNRRMDIKELIRSKLLKK
jgi:O-antigen/teichoic acid export membrane protein